MGFVSVFGIVLEWINATPCFSDMAVGIQMCLGPCAPKQLNALPTHAPKEKHTPVMLSTHSDQLKIGQP